ncbi:helix-turn-helix domain-containing protein [Vagococcus fluvialis]|uniref:helix-turn-helix domain-containing protein n=1 Tax=Vagococcus fluvialis TaxID=2738 RepID=UPI003B213120
MSTAMQKIILKEFADLKNVTVRQIAEGTGISESIVNSMYNTGEFDGNDININDILEIMDFLGIEKVSSLVPRIR